MLATKASYSENMLVNILLAALREFDKSNNPPPMPELVKAFATYLPQFNNNSTLVLKLDDYQKQITDLIINTFDVFITHPNYSNLLIGVLEWKNLNAKFRAQIFSKILTNASIVESRGLFETFILFIIKNWPDFIAELTDAKEYFGDLGPIVSVLTNFLKR